MSPLASWLGERLFLHVWELSLYGSGLLLLVMLIDLVWRDKVPLRFRQVLGILAALRLLVPITFTSPAGVFGRMPSEPPGQSTKLETTVSASPVTQFDKGERTVPASNVDAPAGRSPARGVGVRDVAAGVWLAGVFGLVALTLMRYARLKRGLRAGRVPGERLDRLIEACAWEMGLRRPPIALLTGHVNTPAVTGLLRVQLLLPENFEAELSEDEQRMVLLHELAHVRHRDLWVNWLIALVRAVHWFNPLVWFAFRRMRLQQELLCDRAVIARIGEPAAAEYGAALVRVMERFVTPRAVPGLLPVVTNQNQLKERITMLMQKQSPGRKLVVAGVIIAAVGAVLVFARAVEETEADSGRHTAERSVVDLRALTASLRAEEAELNRLSEVVNQMHEKMFAGEGSGLPYLVRASDSVRENVNAEYVMLMRDVERAEAVLAQIEQMHWLDNSEDERASYLMLIYPNQLAALGIREMLAERSRLELNLASLLTSYGRNYPDVKEVQAQLDENRKQIQKAIGSFVAGLEAKLSVDKASFRRVEKMFSDASAIHDLRTSPPDSLRELHEAKKALQQSRTAVASLREKVIRAVEAEVKGNASDMLAPPAANMNGDLPEGGSRGVPQTDQD